MASAFGPDDGWGRSHGVAPERLQAQRPPRPRTGGRKSSDRYKSKICLFWLEPDGCPFGDTCWFAHGRDEIRTSANSNTPGNSPATNLRYKVRICRHWQESGGTWCPHGVRCTYAHGEHELRRPEENGQAAEAEAAAAIATVPAPTTSTAGLRRRGSKKAKKKQRIGRLQTVSDEEDDEDDEPPAAHGGGDAPVRQESTSNATASPPAPADEQEDDGEHEEWEALVVAAALRLHAQHSSHMVLIDRAAAREEASSSKSQRKEATEEGKEAASGNASSSGDAAEDQEELTRLLELLRWATKEMHASLTPTRRQEQHDGSGEETAASGAGDGEAEPGSVEPRAGGSKQGSMAAHPGRVTAKSLAAEAVGHRFDGEVERALATAMTHIRYVAVQDPSRFPAHCHALCVKPLYCLAVARLSAAPSSFKGGAVTPTARGSPRSMSNTPRSMSNTPRSVRSFGFPAMPLPGSGRPPPPPAHVMPGGAGSGPGYSSAGSHGYYGGGGGYGCDPRFSGGPGMGHHPPTSSSYPPAPHWTMQQSRWGPAPPYGPPEGHVRYGSGYPSYSDGQYSSYDHTGDGMPPHHAHPSPPHQQHPAPYHSYPPPPPPQPHGQHPFSPIAHSGQRYQHGGEQWHGAAHWSSGSGRDTYGQPVPHASDTYGQPSPHASDTYGQPSPHAPYQYYSGNPHQQQQQQQHGYAPPFTPMTGPPHDGLPTVSEGMPSFSFPPHHAQGAPPHEGSTIEASMPMGSATSVVSPLEGSGNGSAHGMSPPRSSVTDGDGGSSASSHSGGFSSSKTVTLGAAQPTARDERQMTTAFASDPVPLRSIASSPPFVTAGLAPLPPVPSQHHSGSIPRHQRVVGEHGGMLSSSTLHSWGDNTSLSIESAPHYHHHHQQQQQQPASPLPHPHGRPQQHVTAAAAAASSSEPFLAPTSSVSALLLNAKPFDPDVMSGDTSRLGSDGLAATPPVASSDDATVTTTNNNNTSASSVSSSSHHHHQHHHQQQQQQQQQQQREQTEEAVVGDEGHDVTGQDAEAADAARRMMETLGLDAPGPTSLLVGPVQSAEESRSANSSADGRVTTASSGGSDDKDIWSASSPLAFLSRDSHQ